MTNQQGAPEALRQIARYKIGYTTDDWGMRSSTPSGIPDHAGAWVRYEDHVAALVEAQQPANHVQKPAEIEHVTGDVSKNSVESNMAQRAAPSAAGFDVLRNVATLWAWMAIDGMEQLRNLAYGFGDAETALKSVESQYKRCREASDALDVYMAACAPTPQADSQPAPVPEWLPFSKRMQIADRHGVKVTAEFNALVRDVIQTYLETHALRAASAPADSVTAPAGGSVAQYVQVLPKRARIPKDFLLPNCVDKQYHAGRLFGSGKAVWHTDGEGKFWCGQWHHRTPRELESECLSILHDLWAIAGISQPTPPAQAADSVLEDAARWIGTAQAELDGVETDDANNCLKAARGALEKALAAARKQGANHD